MTDLHAEAIAQGYKDETCSRCGTVFLAHIHFIRCNARPCPMLPDKPRSILDMMLEQRASQTAGQGDQT